MSCRSWAQLLEVTTGEEFVDQVQEGQIYFIKRSKYGRQH